MKYLYVVADTNDADYLSNLTEISDEQLARFAPLFKAIKEFEPYKAKSEADRDWTHHHNFPNGEGVRYDLGEKNAEVLYKDVVSPEVMEEFLWDFVPTGIHTIAKIEVLEVTKKEKIV